MAAEVLTDPLGIGGEFSDGRRRRLLVGESGAALAEYCMKDGLKRERATRRMLKGFADDGGSLGPGVAALVGGRRFSPGPGRDPLVPYEQEQWVHLQATCRRIVDESFA